MCGRQNSIVICNCRNVPASGAGGGVTDGVLKDVSRETFLKDSRCTRPYVFPYKVHPPPSMIYLCGATGARRSRVLSDHGWIGSNAERIRPWSENDPTTHKTVLYPSHRRRRLSTVGDALCLRNQKFSSICFLSKTHFVGDPPQNSMGN